MFNYGGHVPWWVIWGNDFLGGMNANCFPSRPFGAGRVDHVHSLPILTVSNFAVYVDGFCAGIGYASKMWVL